LNRTSLVRHRHRQHDQHRQIKSNKTNLRPASSSTPNPLGRGRHATDTSSLSCCSIQFRLHQDFLREQQQHVHIQTSLHTIDRLLARYPFYSAVYDQDQSFDSNESNLLYNAIVNAHEFGLTLHELYKHVRTTMNFSQCIQLLHDYLVRGHIIAAGSRTRVYVHRKHARSWLIYSIRFRHHDTNNNLDTLLTSALVDSASSDADNMTNESMMSYRSVTADSRLINEQFDVSRTSVVM
jgi:hypothetical protein